jgi:hypothetical protein
MVEWYRQGKLPINPPELSSNLNRSVVAKQEELAKEMIKFASRNIYFILSRVL